MDELRREFRQRTREIRVYLQMLRVVEMVGPTLSGGGHVVVVDQTLVHVMKASVFLQLYSLIEATISQALRRCGEAVRDEGATYDKLVERWQAAWIKSRLKDGIAGQEPSATTRLQAMLAACGHVVRGMAIDFVPKTPNVGNLDDRKIEDLAELYGVELKIRPRVMASVKREVFDSLGAIALIRTKRNWLAHGRQSFSECGREYTVAELRRFAIVTMRYLTDVIASFAEFIEHRRYAA
jgi:hypothetical protein